MNKKNLCIDFDGVLNQYKGYHENKLYTPRKGAKEFLTTLHEKYYIIIHTTRDTTKVREWLNKYELSYDLVSNIKYPAVAYVDDRAVPFTGDYDEVLTVLDDFKPYWEE